MATPPLYRFPALAVSASPFFDTRRNKVVPLAERNAVPAIYHFREYAEAGAVQRTRESAAINPTVKVSHAVSKPLPRPQGR